MEAFPIYFEDKYSIYTLFGDVYENNFEVKKQKQFRNDDQWGHFVQKQRNIMMERGLFCPTDSVNVIVTCSRL